MIDEDLLDQIYPVVRLYINGKREIEIPEMLPEFSFEEVEEIIKFFNKYRIEVMDAIVKRPDLYDNWYLHFDKSDK